MLLATAAPAALDAQWPPDSLTNLQVLPADITVQELVPVMAGFTRALGVRCSACHVGEEGDPLSSYDFASDDKPLKAKARTMLRMVAAINGDHLPRLAGRNQPAVEVQCFTCHRGTRVPRTLQAELRLAYDDGGLDALLGHYRALRDEYYGRSVYDFGAVALADVGGELQLEGALADAEAVHALNVEMNPGDWFAQRQHAMVALMNAAAEGAERAGERFTALRDAYDPRALGESVVNQVGYRLLGRDDPEAAIVVFRINAEAHPDSWNVWDSLGEAYQVAGRTEEAIASYRRSLELNPENQNARDRLEALSG